MMRMGTRRAHIGLAFALLAVAPSRAAEVVDPGYQEIRNLMADQRSTRGAARDALIARGDRRLIFGIVDALFFIAKPFRGEALTALEALAGTKAGASYWDWVEEAGRLEDVEPAPGYEAWKVGLFAHIDPKYRDLLAPGAPRRIRLEEVVSGGVGVDGIPALDDPPMVPAGRARYLDDDEIVFAAERSGEKRAWPLRFLSWHELLNDRLGGEPVALSYCTLCGAGVLFLAVDADGRPRRFGTSGLLLRSNKLMFDRETFSLWSNLTGEAVLGSMAAAPARLEMLPMVRVTWGEWRRRYPDTLVIDLTPELRRRYSAHGFDYRPGSADRARRGVDFPVWRRNKALPAKAEIFGLRLQHLAKAWSLEALEGLPGGRLALLADRVGETPLLVLADRASGAVRAYRRDPAFTFAPSLDHADGLRDHEGGIWRIEESYLVAPDGRRLERLAGHLAFWFGWYAFHPQTELWPAPTEGSN